MKNSFFRNILTLLVLFFCLSFIHKTEHKKELYIIGDSTVRNGEGDGANGLWGWGDLIYQFFDTSRINIENKAIGGRSSRTFQEEGRWNKILEVLKPGDFVLIQFGHNDGGSLNTGRARGTLKGCGNDSVKVEMEKDHSKHVIHTYGWYIGKYIRDAQSKGAIPVVLSFIPRNDWENDHVKIGPYVEWAKEEAIKEKAFYIDLNSIVRSHYNEIGPELVSLLFFLNEHTHTTEAGAKLNAYSVVEGIKKLETCDLKNYLKK